ncbi:hypothetical protein [Phaeobacter inhibens]|uniref:hypothetical protein n=1 Tax=Phaeobacter inhibens TaxID=221822 RepID=UPI000F4BCD34|nr:hypothetical protein [Phaeobacter inhibens]
MSYSPIVGQFPRKLSYSLPLLTELGCVFSQPIDHGWRSAAKGGMCVLPIAEFHPFSNACLCTPNWLASSATVRLPFKALSASLALNSGEWFFRFDVSDLLFVEDQQTANRSLRQCPDFREQLATEPTDAAIGQVYCAWLFASLSDVVNPYQNCMVNQLHGIGVNCSVHVSSTQHAVIEQ